MTLLCIDDDLEDTELLREAITVVDVNCKCVAASSGAEGLRILRGMTPDHIILDINMPKMDGRETLQRIRKSAELRHVPVHILSTTGSSDEVELFRKLGATSFLTKPNSFNELCNFVKTVLRQPDGKA
jgi:DNA-binding response OmpR family regulator